MSSCLKAILESLAPGNPYVVGLYCAPIRQSATSDIGRGNFNNRSRRGGKTGKAGADSAHCCSPDAGIDSRPRPASFSTGCMPYDGGITSSSKPFAARDLIDIIRRSIGLLRPVVATASQDESKPM